MDKCKHCQSTNLVLESRIPGQDVLTANQVALKCGDCGKWLKWCPKEERQLYLGEKKQKPSLENWIKLKTELEMAIISLMPLKSKESKVMLKAYHNVQLVMKSIEAEEMKSE